MDSTVTNELIAGKYKILDRLGRGAFGTTYLALDVQMNTRCVVKITNNSDPEQNARLQSEIKALRRLSHPNIASIYDSGESQGSTYLVTEYLPGETLQDYLKGRIPLVPLEAVKIALGVARALAYAHQQGIIHRDIKPANIFLSGHDTAISPANIKLFDFNVGGELVTAGLTTVAGQIFGTPKYMSPEQFMGQVQTAATDIYDLGLVLFEMLTGKPLFDGASYLELAMQRIFDPVSLDSENFPAALKSILRNCLVKESQRRYASGSALVKVLEDYITTQKNGAITPQAPFQETIVSPLPEGGGKESIPPRHENQTTGAALSDIENPDHAPQLSSTLAVDVPLPATTQRHRWLGVVIGSTLLLTGVPVLMPLFGVTLNANMAKVLGGLGIAFSGVIFGYFFRVWVSSRFSASGNAVGNERYAAQSRTALSETLVIEVDNIINAANEPIERAMAKSVAIMLKEYQELDNADARAQALVKAVEFLEKLADRQVPWYIRYEKLLAFFIALAAVVSGAVTAINGVLHF